MSVQVYVYKNNCLHLKRKCIYFFSSHFSHFEAIMGFYWWFQEQFYIFNDNIITQKNNASHYFRFDTSAERRELNPPWGIHCTNICKRFCLHTNFLSFPAFPKYFASPSLCLNQATCPTVSHTVDGVLTSLMQQHKDATSLSVNQSHMKTKRIKSAKGLSRNKAIITSVVCVIMYWMWSNM